MSQKQGREKQRPYEIKKVANQIKRTRLHRHVRLEILQELCIPQVFRVELCLKWVQEVELCQK